MSEIRDKINKILATKNIPDVDKQRVQKELEACEHNNLLEDIYILYQKVQNNYDIGDVNVLNCAILYYLGITSVKHDSTKDMQIQARRTYGRAGFPDIDMDFDYEKRGLIVEYLINKYGRDRVGNIGTKQTLKTKAALRRVIKILDPENSIVFDKYGKKIKDEHGENVKLENTILSTLPGLMKRADGTFVESVDEAYEEYSEFRRYMDQYPEVRRIASKMEGGISAFGCVASDTPVLTTDGWVRIDQLDSSCKVAYLDRGGEINYTSKFVAHETGHKKLYKMTLENGDFVKVTDEHLMFTDKGCVEFKHVRKNPKEYRILSIKS